MTSDRAWPRALEELALVPGDVPAAVRDEADYWIGTTKFKMRRDYDIAAQKLLGVWAAPPRRRAQGRGAVSRRARLVARRQGRRGAKGLSRAAAALSALEVLVGGVVPHRLARLQPRQVQGGDSVELDGYAQALRLVAVRRRRALVSRLLALARRGRPGRARRLRAAGEDAGRPLSGGKGAYWRGRALDALQREDEAKAVWRALVDRVSVLLLRAAGARAAQGQGRSCSAPSATGARGSAPPLEDLDVKLANDPLIMRVDELLLAGLTVEAGVELRRGEGELIKRYGAAARAAAAVRSLRARRQLQPPAPARRVLLRRPRSSSTPTATPTRANGGKPYIRAPIASIIEKYSPTGRRPALLPLYDHAKGVGLQPARRLVRRRHRPSADDPADVATGGAAHRRALYRRRALRSRRQHPLRRLVHRPPAAEVQGADRARRRQLQRRPARHDEVGQDARRAPARRVHRADARTRRRAST